MNKIAKTFLLAVGMMLSMSANAQENSSLDRIHIGVIGGLHSTSAKFSDLNERIFDSPKSVSGAVFGAFAEFEFGQSRMFSIRPQVSFLSRGTKLEDIQYQSGTGTG
ncbi:MAG: outer membrane beta-barrel protein, partial [Muribaculaceae bacterium]|nr:outer membrane beta-barrel protein [Muribaculaceae bacterium]